MMRRVKFGPSDLMVSPIGLGCMSMSGCYGEQDDNECIATIHEAMEQLISDARDGSYERVLAESEAVPAQESSFPPPPREVSASTFPPSGSMSSFPPPTTSTPPPVAADGSPEPGADQRPPI